MWKWIFWQGIFNTSTKILVITNKIVKYINNTDMKKNMIVENI